MLVCSMGRYLAVLLPAAFLLGRVAALILGVLSLLLRGSSLLRRSAIHGKRIRCNRAEGDSAFLFHRRMHDASLKMIAYKETGFRRIYRQCGAIFL